MVVIANAANLRGYTSGVAIEIDNSGDLHTRQRIAAVVVNTCHLHTVLVAVEFVENTGDLYALDFFAREIGQSGDFQPSADFRGAYQRVAAQARPPLAAAS